MCLPQKPLQGIYLFTHSTASSLSTDTMSRMLYKDRKSSQGWPKHEQGRGEGGLSNCSWEERGLLYTLWWAPVPPPHPVPSPSHTGDSLRRGPEWQAAPPFRPLSWAQGQPAGQGGSQRSVEALAPRTPGPGHWGPCLPLWLAWWGGPRQTLRLPITP